MYKNNRLNIILPTVLALVLILGILLGGVVFRTRNAAPVSRSSGFMPGNNKIDMLLSLIRHKYVDTVDMTALTEGAIPLILEELDPHSTYIPAETMAEANESLDGEFDGIGVTFNMATDTVRVLSVIPGGPSAKAGIQGGDRIIQVNGETIAGVNMNQDSVVKRLRGPRGSKVDLTIHRIGFSDPIPVTVTRGAIPIRSIPAAYLLHPGIGYIKFEQFSRNAHAELVSAIETLRRQGMEKLILDIRGNAGGFLESAIAIAKEFFADREMIVYTEGRPELNTGEEYYSDGKGRFADLEMAVLIDEYSASSSEILAGALQDNDRAVIVGRRSFGKGLVQEQIPFADGSAVRLTVSRYYTPSGRSIQKPYSDGIESYNNDLWNRYQHNEFFSADSIHFADSLKYTTKSGRTVYGGGGIMPDVFVPADTSDFTPYLHEVLGRNILYRFTIDYSDRHRDALNAIGSLPELDAFFAKDPGLLDEFVRYAARQGVTAKPGEIARSKKVMLAQLKAYIGRNTKLEDNAFYYNIQNIDSVIERSLEALNR